MRLISEQVKIMLDRMDDHPEEFCKTLGMGNTLFDSKWAFVLSNGEFNCIEKFVLRRKMKRIRREVTRQQIMMTLVDDVSYDPKYIPPVTISTASRFNYPQNIK